MSRRVILLAVFMLLSVVVAGGLGTLPAKAGSPAGTPEYTAERDARRLMRQHWSAFRVQDAQMRSNRLEIAIQTTNAGRRVDFRALVSKQTRRDGTYFYNVRRPEKLYR